MITGGSCTSVPRIHWADTYHNETHNPRTEKSMPAGAFGRPWIERGVPHIKQREDAYTNAAVASCRSALMIHWADTYHNMTQNNNNDKEKIVERLHRYSQPNGNYQTIKPGLQHTGDRQGMQDTTHAFRHAVHLCL